MQKYDLAVIGSGPAGHYGAIQGAKAGKKVVLIEKIDRLGGAAVAFGTVPSKALREATLHLSGVSQRSFYGHTYRVKQEITIDDLTTRTARIVGSETAVFEAQLRRNGIDIAHGVGSFVAPHQIVVESEDGVRLIKADKVLVATGSRPARPPGLDFDGETICDSNQILELKRLPKRLIVVGAGVIGIEYACIFSALGVYVTVINNKASFLEFVDRHVVDVLKFHMQNRNVDFRLNEEVTNLERRGELVVAKTASNKAIAGDCLLYSIGRQGNTDRLNLEACSLEADNRGRLKVNENFQTVVPHVYAGGDVVGFPALASTSREQGRRAVCHAFDIPMESTRTTMPYGIYSIPEISMVGESEEELTEKKISYEMGVARYREITRGQIMGDTEGLLKLLFDPHTLKLLAVHAIGDGATELVHIGQAVMAFEGTIQYFANAVFNYPTLAECYKVAALDGLNRVRMTRACMGEEAMPDPEPDLIPEIVPSVVPLVSSAPPMDQAAPSGTSRSESGDDSTEKDLEFEATV